MKPEAKLTFAAARLARSSPNSWEEFIKAFSEYTSQSAQHCIQSPLDQLVKAQGHAQAIARLHDLFTNCLSNADKLEGKIK